MSHESFADNQFATKWYKFAAERSGFVGNALRLIREKTGQCIEEQQIEFGANDQGFLRLQGMPLPRTESLASDADRIARECGLTNPFAFVQCMILVKRLEHPV